MVKGMGNGTSVPGKPFPCQDVGTEDILIYLWSSQFKPVEQGRTEITADAGVIV
jgi:hypothetical protein